MFARWTFKAALTAVIAAFAVLTGSPLDEPAAYAQEVDRDYVDVSVILEVPDDFQASLAHKLNIIVVNHGARTAYDVEVVVKVESPDGSLFRTAPDPSEVPVGSVSVGPVDGKPSLTWTIPKLGGLQREVLPALVTHEWPTMPNDFDNSELVHELSGEVSTTSFESALHEGNNTSRVWSYNYALTNDQFIQVAVNYTVDVSVDQQNPSTGDTVSFTVTAGGQEKHGRIGNPPSRPRDPPAIDLAVDIELTDGLMAGTPSFKTTSTADVTTSAPGSATYNGGMFNIGTGQARSTVAKYLMVLPVTVASDAVVNEQCLTATLTGNPPPGTGPLDDAIADNVAKVCLGEPPDDPVVLTQREADLFTWYDCVGQVSYPCSNQDSLELVVLGMSASAASDAPYEIFEPDNVIVHVPDPGARNTSSDSDSSALVWSTGFRDNPTVRGDEGFAKPGVHIGDNQTLLAASKWGVEPSGEVGERTGNLTVTISGPGAASAWGIYDDGSKYVSYEYLSEATNGQMYSDVWYLKYRNDIWVEFSKLGTYMMQLQATASLNNNTPSVTTDDTSYTTTETYTFHVGPIADLEVGDAGTCSTGSSGQRAYTIAAANNSLDAAPAVTVTALPTSVVQAIATEGSYSNGVWTIGEMHGKARRSHSGHSENATLTLITEDAADTEITATIQNTQDYEVCIGSDGSDIEAANEMACTGNTGANWHTAKYYDYDASNDTATIKAHT